MLELLDRLGVDRVVTFFYQDVEVAGHRGFVGEVLRWGSDAQRRDVVVAVLLQCRGGDGLMATA